MRQGLFSVQAVTIESRTAKRKGLSVNVFCHMVLFFEATGADNFPCESFSGTKTGIRGQYVTLAIWVAKLWKGVVCFCQYCLSGHLLFSKPNPVPGGVSENCATDFFHIWITPLARFITSCCGRKYERTVALHFISLPESFSYFPASDIYLPHT